MQDLGILESQDDVFLDIWLKVYKKSIDSFVNLISIIINLKMVI